MGLLARIARSTVTSCEPPRRTKRLASIGLVAIALPATAAAEGGMRAIPIDLDHLRIEAREHRIEEHLGRRSLFLRDGAALLREIAFEDGTIEFDVAFGPERGFCGAVVRHAGPGEYEHFYVRPHQSGNPDANQYTPVFHGLSAWQLYHGPGYAAPVEYRFDDWNRVRVVVSGDAAEVYIHDLGTPAFRVTDLKRARAEGAVGLTASFAPAHFSRIRVDTSKPTLRSSEEADAVVEPGTISAWEVSDAFPEGILDGATTLPESVRTARTWTRLEAETSGLANLARVQGLAEGRDTAFARVVLRSDRARLQPLRVGYSDRVRVYLGGRLLYRGDNTYRSRDYRYLGTIGYFDEIYLPLEKGENDLWIAVSERFGGWGLKARLVDAEGISWSPPER